MQLEKLLLAALVLAWSIVNVSAQVNLEKLETRIEAISLEEVLKRDIGSFAACSSDARTRLLCALAFDRHDLLTLGEARGLLLAAADHLKRQPSTQWGSDAFLVAGSSAFLNYHYDAEDADPAKEVTAFRRAEQTLDHLINLAAKSADPAVQRVMTMMAAQAFIETETFNISQSERTKWLTNLANSIVREARYARVERNQLIRLNDLSIAIRTTVVERLEEADDPLRLGRALLNLGNGYLQGSQLTNVEGGRPLVDIAGQYYERAIDVLLKQTSSKDSLANRQLTAVLSMHGLSMMRGTGDEYLAHRRSIAMLRYARRQLTERISRAREIDLWLAEIGARIQLIDRLPIEALQREQVEEAIRLFEVHESTAVSRRQEPDTPLSVATSGTSLYAFRGQIDRNPADCSKAKAYWDRVARQIATHVNVNARNVVYPYVALIDCFVSIESSLGSRHSTDPHRIALKQRLGLELANGRQELLNIRTLNTRELASLWLHEAGGDECKGADVVQSEVTARQRIEIPEFWTLNMQGFLCKADLTSAEVFFKDIQRWLVDREQKRAKSRSGLALLARANRQPLTDLAIVLAKAEMFNEALWLLDFRDRSRFTPSLRIARDRMFRASAQKQSSMVRDIELWLRFDNPTDLESSYTVDGIDSGRVQLRSEQAAVRLGIGNSLSALTLTEVGSSVRSIAKKRRLAWLLVGTHNSGWLVSTEEGSFQFVDINLDRPRMELALQKRYADGDPSSRKGLTFFESRDQSHFGRTQEERSQSVAMWKLVLAELSQRIGEVIVEPLLNTLGRPKNGQLPLVTLIVRNELADLPLHAIQVGSRNGVCSSLIECYLVSNAGHVAELERSSILDSSLDDGIATFWGHSNPAEDELSLASYSAMINDPIFEVTSEAADAMATLRGSGVGLWLVHGEFKPRDPASSSFTLDRTVAVDGIDILSRAPNVNSRHLQILIGCDGALFDGQVQPTEQIGLGEPFLQIGIRSLILPAWNSEVVASRVFTSHLVKSISVGVSPAHAYRDATLFLRVWPETVLTFSMICDPSSYKPDVSDKEPAFS